MNVNWARWIKTSIVKYFDTNKGSYTLFVEGADRHTQDLQTWVEVRTDGPYIREVSKNYYKLTVEVNLLLSSIVNENIYTQDALCGYFQSLFTCIPVFRYGPSDDIANDNVQFGELVLFDHMRESIKLNHFGIIRPDTNLIQSTVEGHYLMWLEGE